MGRTPERSSSGGVDAQVAECVFHKPQVLSQPRVRVSSRSEQGLHHF